MQEQWFVAEWLLMDHCSDHFCLTARACTRVSRVSQTGHAARPYTAGSRPILIKGAQELSYFHRISYFQALSYADTFLSRSQG
jgi:hypothetical protein